MTDRQMENLQLQQKINEDMQRAHDKIETLLEELKTLSTILEERVASNREKFREVESEIDIICDSLDRVRDIGQKRLTILEERCEMVRGEIAGLKTDLKEFEKLKTSAAVQETKLTRQEKTLAVIIGLGVSIISTIITLAISHVLAGG